ncbi:MAG TPA: GntR family transcriptional regulator [Acidimicrobiia bacterium]|nr:GntR family transcriptional regulator [Acidimicrobiia bacterium]
MTIRIDPGSEEPIYAQIAAALEDQIVAGVMAQGDRLPSARALAITLGVNMHTVLRAYSRLRELSLVEIRRGRGGVVVGSGPNLERVARQLVSAAQRSGLSKGDLDGLIDSMWS